MKKLDVNFNTPTKVRTFKRKKNEKLQGKSDLKLVNTSSYATPMDSQGRAMVNMQKLSFKGNTINYSADYYKENTDLSDYKIEQIMQLPIDQQKEAIDLYNEGNITEDYLIGVVQSNTEIKPKILELIRKGIRADIVLDMQEKYIDRKPVKLSNSEIIKKYDDINQWLEKKANPDVLNSLLDTGTELNDRTVERTTVIKNKMLSSPELATSNMWALSPFGDFYKQLNNIDDEAYKTFLSLLEQDYTNFDLMIKMSKDKGIYAKAEELIKSGYSESDASTLVEINDEKKLEKIKKIMNDYSIQACVAESLSKYDDEKDIKTALELKQYCPYIKLEQLEYLPDTLRNKTIEAIEKGLIGFQESESLNKNLHYAIIVASMPDFSYYSELELSYKELEDILNKIQEKSEKLVNFIENCKNGEEYKAQLDKKDMRFLKEHIFENKYYEPEDYIKQYLKLKNLKTAQGENILSCQAFTDKIRKNGLGDFTAIEDEYLYKNIETILSIDPKSEKIKYLTHILTLIQDGKINSTALRKLADLNDIKSLFGLLTGLDGNKNQDSTWNISNNLKDDIDLVFDKNTTSENWIDKYIPTYKNEKEGIENNKVGDTFAIEGEKFIRIKTGETKSQTVKLTKETYAKLFPPVERFLTTQQIMGNCYCIETLMSMYCNDRTRDNLLQAMEEDEKGNIKIQFENYTPVIFEGGKFPNSEDREIYSNGADGYKMFEYAYSCALVEDKIKEAEQKLPKDKLMEFKKFMESNPNNFYIYKDGDKIKWMKYSEFKNKKHSTNLFAKHPYNSFNNYLLGNGGLQGETYKKFGYTSSMYVGGNENTHDSKNYLKNLYKTMDVAIDNVSTLAKAERLLNTPNFFNNHQIQMGIGAHAYCLTQEKDSAGDTKYYLYNPHNQGFPVEFNNLKDLLSKTSTITIIDIKE